MAFKILSAVLFVASLWLWFRWRRCRREHKEFRDRLVNLFRLYDRVRRLRGE